MGRGWRDGEGVEGWERGWRDGRGGGGMGRRE